MATSVPNCCPLETLSPSLTETFSRVPGIGDFTEPDATASDSPKDALSFGPKVGTSILKDPSYGTEFKLESDSYDYSRFKTYRGED